MCALGANRCLRDVMRREVEAIGGEVNFPAFEYCTDNGAMIAYAGALRLLAGQRDGADDEVTARWSLESLAPI